jgi:hypothetical protein
LSLLGLFLFLLTFVSNPGFVEDVFLADLCRPGLGLDAAEVWGPFVEEGSFASLGGVVSHKPCFILSLGLEGFSFLESHV